jgi:protein tyrosine phosphatase
MSIDALRSTSETTIAELSLDVSEELHAIKDLLQDDQEPQAIAAIKNLNQTCQNQIFYQYYINKGFPDIPNFGESILEIDHDSLKIKKQAIIDVIRILHAKDDYPLALELNFPYPQTGLECSLASIAEDFLQHHHERAIQQIQALPDRIRYSIHNQFYTDSDWPDEPDFGAKIEDPAYQTPVFKARVLVNFVRKNCVEDAEFQKQQYSQLEANAQTIEYVAHSQFGRASSRSSSNQFDCVPYDKTRIHLSDDTYVNANLVFGRYILTQSPVDASSPFWKMVDEKKTDVIVMLNGEVGTEFFPYFPTALGESLHFGDRTITFLSQEHVEYDTLPHGSSLTDRTLLLTSPNSRRIIHHVKANNWYDFTCGEEKILLEIFRRVKEHQKNGSPLVTHCSAGKGRSSVFTSLFHLYDKAKAGEPYSLFDTISALRNPETGRCPMMCEGEKQYIGSIRFLRNQHPPFQVLESLDES